MHPLLLECDMRGQVLWMSERTRFALGEAENLVDAIRWTARLSEAGAGVSEFRMWHVLDTREGVLVGAQPIRSREGEDAAGLAGLQRTLLGHYMRLQTAERKLSVRVQRRRGATGAVRQVERERGRLGRELHTGVGQMLAAIRLQLELVAIQLPDSPAPVRQALDRISTLADEALDQVRSISHRLHPPEWQRLTIEAALQQLWDISGIPQKFDSSFEIETLSSQPDPDIKALIYRTAQEALSNLTRHSRATRVRASLAAHGDSAVLTIEDNGIGFDPAGLFSAPASVSAGIGLRSIREHAESVGGSVAIESGPAGTKLELSAPLSIKDV